MKNLSIFSTKKGLVLLSFAIILGVVIGLGMRIIVAQAVILKFTSGTDVQMEGNVIHNIGTPQSNSDSVTVDYVKGSLGVQGTANTIPKFKSADGVGLQNSLIYDDGTNVGIGVTAPLSKLSVNAAGNAAYAGYFDGTSTATGARALYGYQSGLPASSGYSSTGVTGQVNLGTSTGGYFYGVMGIASRATLNASGRAYGVYGSAGNATSGYNYGVYGTLSGTGDGTGIFGTDGTIPGAISGKWGGYFLGNVYTSGNVGIGTTSPGGRLIVKGAGTTTGIGFQTQDSSGAALVTILDNGNVGIGTTSPGAKLDVAGSIKSTGFCISDGCKYNMSLQCPPRKVPVLEPGENEGNEYLFYALCMPYATRVELYLVYFCNANSCGSIKDGQCRYFCREFGFNCNTTCTSTTTGTSSQQYALFAEEGGTRTIDGAVTVQDVWTIETGIVSESYGCICYP